jgi:putative ABC transport system substrate-binding protein
VIGRRRKSMSNKVLFLSLLISFLTFAGLSEAQHPGKIPRVAYLSGGSIISSNTEAFQQGLRDLGYIEGKNIVFEWRFAEGNRDRLRAFAAELVRLKVDVIVASGGGDTRAAKEATAAIPIVMAQTDDPIASGFVASLARPGGNITGLSTLAPELSGKRLEILKEVVARLSRVAVFGTTLPYELLARANQVIK